MSRNVNFKEKQYQELALAIGQLALVWNDLTMVVSSLFWALTRIPNGLAADLIWNSVRSDRFQREMALALARSKALGFELNENLRMEIVWCLTEIGKLEDLRNDAIHTPVYENHKGKIVAWFELGHPRAKGLANKDLLLEFAWFYDAAVVLRQYCGELSGFVGRSDGSAPTRPKLPNRASAALKVS